MNLLDRLFKSRFRFSRLAFRPWGCSIGAELLIFCFLVWKYQWDSLNLSTSKYSLEILDSFSSRPPYLPSSLPFLSIQTSRTPPSRQSN